MPQIQCICDTGFRLVFLRIQKVFKNKKHSFCVEFSELLEFLVRIKKSDVEKTQKRFEERSETIFSNIFEYFDACGVPEDL